MTRQENQCAVESLEQRMMFAVMLGSTEYSVGDVSGDANQRLTLQTKRSIRAGALQNSADAPTGAGGATQGIIGVLIAL